MKITPLEIRQKTFEKAFRGLDKDEVQAYLTSLSQEWEKVLDENKELRIKLEASEKEVEKLREVENSLFKTLKTAEDTGANMIDQAEKAAELHLRESQINAEALLNDAQTKARDTIEEAEMRARQAVEEMEDQLKSLGQAYKTLENYKEDLISNIRMLSKEALEKVDRMAAQVKYFDIDEQIQQAKSISSSYKYKTKHNSTSKKTEKAAPATNEIIQEITVDEPAPVPQESKPESTKSFFDDIE